MRDVNSFTDTVTSWTTSPGSVTGGSATSVNMRFFDSARDDSVSTIPDGSGAYFRPTTYRGWYYSGTPAYFDYKSKSGVQLPRRYYGRSPWSAYSVGLNVSRLYGCTTSNRPDVPGWLISTMESQLMQQITAQNWNIGNFLGELPETVGFIVECGKDIAALFRAYAHRRTTLKDVARELGSDYRFHKWNNESSTHGISPAERRMRLKRKLRKVSKTKGAANAYLALMYGILPLMRDIHDALGMIMDGVNSLTSESPHAFAKQTEPLPEPVRSSTVTDQGSQFKGEYGVKGEITVKVKSPLRATLASMGILDPLSVAWEVTTLSFVLDWFLPVGSFLSALSGSWGLMFLHGYRTEYVRWSAKLNWTLGTTFLGGTPASVSGWLLAFNRLQYLTFPIPVPYLQGLDKSLVEEWTKTATLIALGVQRA